jgi:O-succinylbenzoate synthase
MDMSGKQLLSWAKPKYIILKPTLLGGLDLAEDWIRLAENEQIGWWSTSALEGNVGLACIAQWVSKFNPTLPQGLGTGSLFKENYNPQTRVVGEQLWFLP